jgi:very-short-patch-repair endonuclease
MEVGVSDLDPTNRWHTKPDTWDKIKLLARQKRQEPTHAEVELWERLRNGQVSGSKFRRQHSIDKFIVDFYCHEARLIIEVDGFIHEYSVEEDTIRQEFLESLGFTVIRFTNDEVLSSLNKVIDRITETLATSPLSASGEGSGVR